MSWFRKPERKLRASERRDLPSDVFEKCPDCGEILYRARLEQNAFVCPDCGHHMRLAADGYLELLLDDGRYTELYGELRSADPLGFVDLKPYPERLAAAERKSGTSDAVRTVIGALEGIGIGLAVMDFTFIGGSMGSVVGEKIVRLGRRSLAEREPLMIVSASGGARMMEGILSLMQLAKTAAMLGQLHEAGIPFISILTDPTTGGVTASYAMLGDAILAEPGALVGFAGPRVIEQTIRQELPEGFQRSEFLLEHGLVDAIVDRRELKSTAARLLRHMLGLPERAGQGPTRLGAENGAGPVGARVDVARQTAARSPTPNTAMKRGAPQREPEAKDGKAATSPRAADSAEPAEDPVALRPDEAD